MKHDDAALVALMLVLGVLGVILMISGVLNLVCGLQGGC